MTLKKAKFEKVLKKKGFREIKQGKHKRYVLFVDGEDTGIWTVTSHGSKKTDISGKLLSDIKNQLKLNWKEFDAFEKCPLTYEKYVSLLRERGYI